MTVQRTVLRILYTVVSVLICFGRYEWIADLPAPGASFWNAAEARDRELGEKQGGQSGASNSGAQTQALNSERAKVTIDPNISGGYRGTLTGDNFGLWSGTIDEQGNISIKGKFREGGKFKAKGTVTPTGEFTATTKKGKTVISGAVEQRENVGITSDTHVVGSWTDNKKNKTGKLEGNGWTSESAAGYWDY